MAIIGLLGIEDKYVLLSYLLCIGSTLLCFVYGLLNWNRGQEDVEAQDVKWVEEDKKIEPEV